LHLRCCGEIYSIYIDIVVVVREDLRQQPCRDRTEKKTHSKREINRCKGEKTMPAIRWEHHCGPRVMLQGGRAAVSGQTVGAGQSS
jgi:hypothetical protein